MSKFDIQKGDKINARTPAIVDEFDHYKKCGGHIPYDTPLTVTKVFNHGVRTKEMGYIHNNNILSKVYECNS